VTSVISAISGHFTRSLLFGPVVPVAVFLVLAAALLAPFASEAVERFQALDDGGRDGVLRRKRRGHIVIDAIQYCRSA
jgi:hypothetical protein